MRAFRFDHLDDTQLLRLLANLIAESRQNTARTIAVIAEVDRRRLYLPAGYTSMKAYCIEALGLSEDAAFKRFQVARVIDEFPALLEMLADGRLHLTGARMVAPHLTPENAGELLAAATHKTCFEIQRLLAECFPESDLLAVPQPTGPSEPASRQVEVTEVGVVVDGDLPSLLAPEAAADQGQLASRQVASGPTKNLAPRRIPLSLLPETHDKIRYAKELLGHELPSGDDALVVERAMAEMIQRAEKRELRSTRSPQDRQCRSSTNRRHIPKRVKRAVWERDGGQCTFVGNNGHRCGARKFVEFDHIEPVAKGGASTPENLRLRCRAHNQFEAERAFGAGFMSRKREAVRHDTVAARSRMVASDTEDAKADQETQDILNGLRELGFRAGESRRAAEFSATLPNAALEQRMRAALNFLRPKIRHHAAEPPSVSTLS